MTELEKLKFYKLQDSVSSMICGWQFTLKSVMTKKLQFPFSEIAPSFCSDGEQGKLLITYSSHEGHEMNFLWVVTSCKCYLLFAYCLLVFWVKNPCYILVGWYQLFGEMFLPPF
jgi:hypothetical protein